LLDRTREKLRCLWTQLRAIVDENQRFDFVKAFSQRQYGLGAWTSGVARTVPQLLPRKVEASEPKTAEALVVTVLDDVNIVAPGKSVRNEIDDPPLRERMAGQHREQTGARNRSAARRAPDREARGLAAPPTTATR
jgi:hypothetical protein